MLQDALKLLQGWDCSPYLAKIRSFLYGLCFPDPLWYNYLSSGFFTSFLPWVFLGHNVPVLISASFFLALSPFLLCCLVLSPLYLGEDAASPSYQPSHVLVAGGTSIDSAGSGVLTHLQSMSLC